MTRIYLDNASTSYPKPASVIRGTTQAMTRLGANPGRSGHCMARQSENAIFLVRQTISDFFGAGGPEFVSFCAGCTCALNTIIKGCLKPGDHVIISHLEHNAVRRPLEKLEAVGITYTAFPVDLCDPLHCYREIESAITENTRLILVMAASNVFGVRLPIAKIGKIAARHGILFAVDGAQGGGVIPINMTESGIDFLALPSHKGLLGPMGAGVLIAKKPLETLIEGGTGSSSLSALMPAESPERFEAGTLPLPAIIGLHAGIKFVNKLGLDNIHSHEISLIKMLHRRLSCMDGISLYTGIPECDSHIGVLSFNINGMESGAAAKRLSESGIAVRAGLHCAPLAHIAAGTVSSGTVRVSVSPFSTEEDIDRLVCDVRRIKR